MTLTEIIRNKTGMDFPSLNLKGLKLFGENLWKSPLGDLFQAGDIFEYEGMVLLYKEMKWAFVDVGLGKHVKIADPVLEIVGYSPEADVENLTLKLMDCIKVNSR